MGEEIVFLVFVPYGNFQQLEHGALGLRVRKKRAALKAVRPEYADSDRYS
ncbi:hypothetical protein AXF42_Ash011719 [Apostasia shenzhenica]|uniref:Uncharacterized protein n=1 Tax=Apostasia shenzhenica TaxID=1088818 RepID=A0A2H9ZUS4_9ASPA|nr:hypothetical protein AXF42_Ash011718 [Apostasia shenzhenica]PKA47045.1 hypothetical protein AXF42_Ash011719 [Apostasia shenzhenica]